jgi:hypothetical protein
LIVCLTFPRWPAQVLGRAAGQLFKSEGQGVVTGVAAICAAGVAVYGLWVASIADKKPKTMNASWQKATIKYRAEQMQDPITNQ